MSDSPPSSHQSRWYTKCNGEHSANNYEAKTCESHNISHSRFHIHAVTSVNEYANVWKKERRNNKNENCENEWIGEQTDQLIKINANDEPPQKRNEERERTEWATHDSRSHFMLIAHWKLKHFHGNGHRRTITYSAQRQQQQQQRYLHNHKANLNLLRVKCATKLSHVIYVPFKLFGSNGNGSVRARCAHKEYDRMEYAMPVAFAICINLPKLSSNEINLSILWLLRSYARDDRPYLLSSYVQRFRFVLFILFLFIFSYFSSYFIIIYLFALRFDVATDVRSFAHTHTYAPRTCVRDRIRVVHYVSRAWCARVRWPRCVHCWRRILFIFGKNLCLSERECRCASFLLSTEWRLPRSGREFSMNKNENETIYLYF